MVAEVVGEMDYLRVREQKLRDTNESTNTRVKWFGFGTTSLLIGIWGWQILYLRAYFRWVPLSYGENVSSLLTNVILTVPSISFKGIAPKTNNHLLRLPAIPINKLRDFHLEYGFLMAAGVFDELFPEEGIRNFTKRRAGGKSMSGNFNNGEGLGREGISGVFYNGIYVSVFFWASACSQKLCCELSF